MDKKKKIIIIIIGTILLLAAIFILYFIFIKNGTKKLVCTYKDSEYEIITTIYYKGGSKELKKIVTENIFTFDNAQSANNYYNLNKDISKDITYTVDNNKVIEKINESFQEIDDYTVDRYKDYLEQRNYTCKQ